MYQRGNQKPKKKKDNDLQTTTQKTKDWVTRTPLKSSLNSGALEE
jgi:hypothetical protein